MGPEAERLLASAAPLLLQQPAVELVLSYPEAVLLLMHLTGSSQVVVPGSHLGLALLLPPLMPLLQVLLVFCSQTPGVPAARRRCL